MIDAAVPADYPPTIQWIECLRRAAANLVVDGGCGPVRPRQNLLIERKERGAEE